MFIKNSSAILAGRISLKSVTTLGIEKQDQRQSSALNISASIFSVFYFFPQYLLIETPREGSIL